MNKPNNQIKSKKRISDHGEVFTSEREVNAMLDLVKQETERIDSRFLEPACGTGNFLVEILKRKLKVVKDRYSKSKPDYEKFIVVAISSVYGVDILHDNIIECRNRLYELFINEYNKVNKKNPNSELADSIKYILSKNILHGNALTMLTLEGEPIIFSEWSFIMGNLIKRRDYKFDQLLERKKEQISIFKLDTEDSEDIKAFIPTPIKEFPLIDYRRVQYYE